MTSSQTSLRIGLTGGIGSGKSTVARMLQERGAAVIDADAIARSMTAAHGMAMPAIAQKFGNKFITPEGALDRDRMRAHAFQHAEVKRELEAIIHPLVAQETTRAAQKTLAQGHRTLIFDVPLLVESGARWRAQVDRVLVVDCEIETQIQRVLTRNGWTRETVQGIVASQATRDQKLAAADWVIYNDTLSLDELRAQVEALPIETT